MLANQAYRNRFALLFGINSNEIEDNHVVNNYESLNNFNFNSVHHELIRQNINQIVAEDLNNIRNNYIFNNYYEEEDNNNNIINSNNSLEYYTRKFENDFSQNNDSNYLNAFLNSLNKIRVQKDVLIFV